MKTRVITAAVIEKEGKILLGKKRTNVGPYPNTWHLPGGGLRLTEETAVEGLKREIREETGIELSDIKPLDFNDDKEPDKNAEMTYYIFLVYRALYKSGTVSASDDITELRWFDKSELKQISLARPSITLFQKLSWI